jgi:hypothetical protein
MLNTQALFIGGGVGAALMYLMDPAVGRRRRAKLPNQCLSQARGLQDSLDKGVRDAGNRLYGAVAETRHWLGQEDVPDSKLAERVRSKMGRYVSHAGAIEVDAHDGHVTLSGPILPDEVAGLVAAVRGVPGVRDLENNLDVYNEPGDVSALQGGIRPVTGERWDLCQESWAPGTRLAVAATGGTLLGIAALQRFPVACVLGTVGLGLMATALGPSASPAGIGGSRHYALDGRKNRSSPESELVGGLS